MSFVQILKIPPSKAALAPATLALGLGFATFLPIGINYLLLLFLLPFVVIRVWQQPQIIDWQWRAIILLLMLWPLTAFFHGISDDFYDRYAHVFRVGLFLLLGLSLLQHERRWLLIGFLLGALYTALVASLHHLFLPLPDWPLWHQIIETQGNASSQKWILAALAGVCWMYLASLNRWSHTQKIIFLTIGAFILVSVASWSISRNAYILVPVALLAIAIYGWRNRPIILLGILLAGMFALLALFQLGAVNQRLDAIGLELGNYWQSGDYSGSVSVRAHMYLTAAQHMLANPILGTGLGSWGDIWAQASTLDHLDGINNPHNDFLLWGMETGLLGLLTLLAIGMKLAWTSWKTPHPGAAMGWILTWGLMVTACFNAPFRDAALGMSLIILAVALSRWERPAAVSTQR